MFIKYAQVFIESTEILLTWWWWTFHLYIKINVCFIIYCDYDYTLTLPNLWGQKTLDEVIAWWLFCNLQIDTSQVIEYQTPWLDSKQTVEWLIKF
jgi:hypothetical protein